MLTNSGYLCFKVSVEVGILLSTLSEPIAAVTTVAPAALSYVLGPRAPCWTTPL